MGGTGKQDRRGQQGHPGRGGGCGEKIEGQHGAFLSNQSWEGPKTGLEGSLALTLEGLDMLLGLTGESLRATQGRREREATEKQLTAKDIMVRI